MNAKKFDIVFIVPHYGVKSGFIWKTIEYRFHSSGVLSMAAYLGKFKYKVAVINCNLEQILEKNFFKEFEKRFKTLNKYYHKTYLQYYLRPSFIGKNMFKLNSWQNIKVLFMGALSIISIMFSAMFKTKKK